jgi:bacillolysin
MAGPKDVSYHAVLHPRRSPVKPSRGRAAAGPAATHEVVAQQFLEGLVLEQLPSVRGISGDTMTPDDSFQHHSTTRAPSEQGAQGSMFVAFQQTHKSVPIFGARATVEMDGMTAMAVAGSASERPDKSEVPKLTTQEAETVAAQGGDGKAESIELVFYFSEQDVWHLAYLVSGIRVPHKITSRGHGPGGSPRADAQLREVLVDAHDGAILLDYSATPLVAISPSYAKGLDEDGVEREFFTNQCDDGRYELRDDLNVTVTFDAEGNDIESPRPAAPVREAGGDWKDLHRAAISAHSNATIVLDYFRNTLKRSGLDNKSSALTSIVRSTYRRQEPPPTWRNAVWWKGAMWYGQENRGDRIVSFATRLEIAAHEMTHGLIEQTAKLRYYKESGALNESLADIFGVIISNRARVGNASTDDWSWIIGKGLGAEGKDIRDLADPGRLGYPGHYTKLDPTSADNGGVHINSNIHNTAAYNVLRAKDAAGAMFRPDDVALLYYLALLRLGPLSTFRDALNALLHAAATLYRARGPDRVLEAIRTAYGAAGITA